MKSISSIPGASLFRFISALILIFLFVFFFLNKVGQFERDVEEAKVSRKVTELNSMLYLVFVESFLAKNKLSRLSDLHLGNPFPLLKEKYVGLEYFGEVKVNEKKKVPSGVWYFDEGLSSIVYQSRFSNKKYSFQLVFDYWDKNNSNKYEVGIDKARNISIIENPIQND